MPSLWGAQPPLVPKLELCRCPLYEVLSLHFADTLPSLPVPRQHTTPGHLLHTTDSSSPLQLLLLLLSLSPQSKVHPCLCTPQVLCSWLPLPMRSLGAGGQATGCTCVSLPMFPALLLYCITVSLLYYRVLLSYCIV